jgi:hypothetical protein
MSSGSGGRGGSAVSRGATLALEAQDVAFLRLGFLSMIAASCGPDRVPSTSRALGHRLSADLRQVTMFFSSADARELLDHVALTGRIAAVFSMPRTHKALQLKGVDARVEKPESGDLQLISAYRQAFVSHLADMGYPRHLIEALIACEPDDLAAVTFTPCAAFSQTPGPHAGQAIGGTT